MKNFNKNVGLTNVELKNNILTITHTGNMGNSIERSVNPNLKLINIESIEELKNKYTLISEEGCPDYLYQIKFKIN